MVITGASSGIGRLAARRFAEGGARLVLAARTESSLQEAAAECEEAGGTALVVPTDVADHRAVEALAARAIAAFGRIDVWVNNAAVMAYGEADAIPHEVHRRVIEVTLLGQVYGTVAVLPHFKRQGEGVLINVASLYAKMTSPFVAPYVTSKFGVLGFSEVVRQELGDSSRIRVSTILPGSVDTPIFRHSGNYAGRKPRPVPPVSSPERVARAIVAAAANPEREVTVGLVQHVLAWGHAVFPRLYSKLAPVVMRRAGFLDEPADDAPGNVFEPMPEWNRVAGDWRNGALRWVSAGAGAVGAGAAVLATRRRRG